MTGLLYAITLLELFMGGGGRVTAVGPVSLRMVLFGICLLVAVAAALIRTRKTDGVALMIGIAIAYSIMQLCGLVVGSINGASSKEMLPEIQQSAYWLAGPYFAMLLQSERRVRTTAHLVIAASVLLSLLYVGAILAFLAGIMPKALVEHLSESGEIAFRGEDFFFYKGFLYLCIGLEFLVAMRVRFWLPMAMLVGAALVLTLTRGFIISSGVAVIALLFCQGRWRSAVVAVWLALLAGFFVFIYFPSTGGGLATARDISTSQRIEDWNYMVHHATSWTFVFGEGFGSLINDRYNIENSFLWVVWKLGLVGLIFWLFPFFLCFHYYLLVPDRRDNRLANAYFFGVMLVYVQTVTNPYLTNPIGLSFVMLGILSLRRLAGGAHPARIRTPPARRVEAAAASA